MAVIFTKVINDSRLIGTVVSMVIKATADFWYHVFVDYLTPKFSLSQLYCRGIQNFLCFFGRYGKAEAPKLF